MATIPGNANAFINSTAVALCMHTSESFLTHQADTHRVSSNDGAFFREMGIKRIK